MQEPPFYASDEVFTFADYQSEVFSWIADGIGVDFTGCTATMDFRVAPDDPAPLFAAAVVNLGTAGANPGQVSFTIARASLATVTAPVAHADLLIHWPDGTITEFLHFDAYLKTGNTY